MFLSFEVSEIAACPNLKFYRHRHDHRLHGLIEPALEILNEAEEREAHPRGGNP